MLKNFIFVPNNVDIHLLLRLWLRNKNIKLTCDLVTPTSEHNNICKVRNANIESHFSRYRHTRYVKKRTKATTFLDKQKNYRRQFPVIGQAF
ncbi:unnamed protein product [Acanthoscelides obtectus]|uniref:Uncharacterized protein n=1 Tax=Acanthoscelides obtectus TaxID=200917 RepID=A0A9P0MMG3_ACAOB|nr:unnamed protein product [Acanthoscelides obtectus]CAK1634481.1 hypothetical protein AOBTE_LOCUS8767 [Acanthoscelides obtectus]